MNNNDKQPRPRKVFDVMRPGKAPASPTSRPVIVGHKPQTPDDQFVPRSNTRLAGDPSEERPLLGHKQPELQPDDDTTLNTASESTEPVTDGTPPSKPLKEAKATTPLETEIPDSLPPDDEEPDDDELTTPEPEQSVSSHESAQPSEAPEVPEEPTDIADAPPATALPADQPAAKPQQDTQKTTNTDTFAKPMTQDEVLAETDAPMLEHAFVSHHHKHRTKLWEWVLIFLLMVIVAAAALNFLLDAEVITTGVDIPHTDLLK
jgi:hypothetical protein